MTKEEKTPFMIEWWTKTFELIIDSQISRENLIEIVRNSTTHLKDGCQWLFHTLERCEIPLLIFSAGLATKVLIKPITQCINGESINKSTN